MIKEIDELLQHWADQQRGRGLRQCSPLGRLAEFKGVMPQGSGQKGSRDPLGLGELDDLSWQVEQALRTLSNEDQVLAHEHYRWHGYNDAKAMRLGMAERTYYERLDRLHVRLKAVLRASFDKKHRA